MVRDSSSQDQIDMGKTNLSPERKPDCPFCGILETETERVIRQGTNTAVFLSNPRLMPGHTLVVPKRHIEKPWELDPKEILEIFEQIRFIEDRLLNSGLATGCDIRQNYRPFMQQGRIKIDHVHFHILPRTMEDELYQKSMRHETELFLDLEDEERTDVLELFK